MITGRKKLELKVETILSYITEYDIYHYYCPYPFHLNEVFRSPMPDRKDADPSFLIGVKGGYLKHIDFGDVRYRGDCMDFVQQVCSIPTLYEALKRIDKDFGLGISDGVVKDYKTNILSTYKQPEMEEKKQKLIQVKSRRFDTADLAYWKQFHISAEDLKREEIYAVKSYFIDRKRQAQSPTELVFAYLYEDKYWKIYKPNGEKKRKWLTNAPIDLVDGLVNINGCDKAMVTKSKKDKIVIQKIFPCVCAVQNESIVALNEHTVEHLKRNSKEVFLSFDSDEPGVKNSKAATSLFGFNYINVPKKYLSEGIKDYADLVKVHGYDPLIEQFKKKGLI